MLDFLRLRAIAGIEQVQGRRYTRSISLDGAQGTVAVEPGKGDALLASASCGDSSASTWAPLPSPSPRPAACCWPSN